MTTDIGNKSGTPENKVVANGTITGDVVSGKDKIDSVKAAYTNTFPYELPETGGARAQWYTMAGVPMTALFFCLWYKKRSQGEGAAD